MEGRIHPDAILDYVEFEIFPSQNRYEASVRSGNRSEKVTSGPLEQLLLHSPLVSDLFSNGSNTNFKILAPENVNDADWFTTATLTSFLHIVGLPDILSIANEISQLEETRKFQLSLSVKAEVGITTSVESKNELLRAVDLRLTALKEELAAAFNQATGSRCSPKDISDLGNFTRHFGAKDIRNLLQKLVELSLVKDSSNDSLSKVEKSAPSSQSSQLDTPIKYGVSPAKLAEIERQSSTDSEDSKFSSEEDQPSVERSRTLTRSAAPKRSASPMRRIQIGRSGSRRAAALSIKSLNYFPAREKLVSQRDAAGNSSEEDDSEQPRKNNVLRMSVQDKISLFESKRRDQEVDIHKTKTLLNTTVGANKAVLRRWSSGMGENSSSVSPQNVTPDATAESDIDISKTQSCAQTAENVKSLSPERGASESLCVNVDTPEPEREEGFEKHLSSTEWTQQKGAELNELFMKMMESKPVRHLNVTSDNRKSKDPKVQRGGFYDNYKQKREEKLQGEAAAKKAEKEAQFKVMQQFLDEKKAEIASTNVSDLNRRHITANKPQNAQKNSTQLMNSRKAASKASVVKKATSKSSPLPATRKSWPSTPSPRATRASTAKTPTGPTSTVTTPTSRKPQSASSVVRSSTNGGSSQPRAKTLKATEPDANKRIKVFNEKKQPTPTINTKTTKAEVRTPKVATTTTMTSTARPTLYNKVTKKSSVVPLETKPFLRKGSGISPGGGPVVIKTKVVAHPEETLGSSGGLIQAEENKVVTRADITSQNQEKECGTLENFANVVFESQVVSSIKYEESESSNQLNVIGHDGLKRIEASEINTGTEEELVISPTAWVETEENHQDAVIQCIESQSPIQIVSPVNVAAQGGLSHARVRHSLSQMLLEERSEADTDEWGNAEHPSTMVYQKDAPKGLKRLLKFARKSKADSQLIGCSSPSAFSEGENGAEEYKGQFNMNIFTTQNHQRIPGGHVDTTKAFRGSKMKDSYRYGEFKKVEEL